VPVPYRFAKEWSDGSDYASGFVLHSAPGYPAFPARLAVEVFLRARSHLPGGAPLTLWDPCCGCGHLATVLGWTRRTDLRRVVCSDADPESVALARRNLALLTPEGLAARAAERRELSARFDKPGYLAAADAADRLAARLTADGGALPWAAERADVFDPRALAAVVGDAAPDVVFADVPYGEQTHWGGGVPGDPIPALLRSVAAVVPPHAVLAVADRARKIVVAPVRPLERLKLGTRSVVLVRAADVAATAAG
jgi:23S rRNA (guanine2535-N1)-methyltransferase